MKLSLLRSSVLALGTIIFVGFGNESFACDSDEEFERAMQMSLRDVQFDAGEDDDEELQRALQLSLQESRHQSGLRDDLDEDELLQALMLSRQTGASDVNSGTSSSSTSTSRPATTSSVTLASASSLIKEQDEQFEKSLQIDRKREMIGEMLKSIRGQLEVCQKGQQDLRSIPAMERELRLAAFYKERHTPSQRLIEYRELQEQEEKLNKRIQDLLKLESSDAAIEFIIPKGRSMENLRVEDSEEGAFVVADHGITSRLWLYADSLEPENKKPAHQRKPWKAKKGQTVTVSFELSKLKLSGQLFIALIGSSFNQLRAWPIETNGPMSFTYIVQQDGTIDFTPLFLTNGASFLLKDLEVMIREDSK